METVFEGFVDPAHLERVSINGVKGLYFLFKENELIYIGSSINAPGRARIHLYPNKDRKDQRAIDFDSFSFLPWPAANMREIEIKYIQHFQPHLNGLHNPKWVNPCKGVKRGKNLPRKKHTTS